MSSVEGNAKNVGLILLAAGASTRLGHPKQLKQLLIFQGQTLLHHSLQTALAFQPHTAVMVLGANADILEAEIKNNYTQVVVNTNWQEGMASSIRCGIQRIKEIDPGIEGIILMTCDQPYVTADLLNELTTTHKKTGKPIVVCGYADTFGPPVFFHHILFDELLGLKGDAGAKSIIRQHSSMVEVIPFPDGAFDVDTAADYKRINNKDNH